MEPQTLALSLNPIPKNYSSNVDTSRPFRSVKEAVAVFGERFLVGEIYSPKPFSFSPPTKHEIITPWKYSSSPQSPREVIDDEKNNSGEVLDALKKLEAELEETKMELKLLKKREAETEVALATLNAEFHKNMSQLAEAEADAAKKAIESHRRREDQERKRELVKKKENSSTLAQILCLEENDIDVEAQAARFLGGRRSEGKMMMMMKKKPIVPLVTDLFFKKKGSPNNSTILHSTIYASPNMYFS